MNRLEKLNDIQNEIKESLARQRRDDADLEDELRELFHLLARTIAIMQTDERRRIASVYIPPVVIPCDDKEPRGQGSRVGDTDYG